jgi:hypothetical protein
MLISPEEYTDIINRYPEAPQSMLLPDMIWVYNVAEVPGEDQSLRLCREWLRSSPGKFLKTMEKLGRTWLQTVRAYEELRRALKVRPPTEESPAEKALRRVGLKPLDE